MFKMKRPTAAKTICAIFLAVIAACLVCLPAGDSYAEGGTVTVNVGNEGSWPSGTSFTFDLYKVGEFDHSTDGKAIFKLYESLEDSGAAQTLSTPSSYEQGEASDADWSQQWLDTANTLATYINGMTEYKPASLGQKTVSFSDEGASSFSYTVGSNGLFLLVGSPKEVGDTLWTPQPMFIRVVNGDTTVNFNNSLGVKMTSRKIVHEHNVSKIWSGDTEVADYVRPDHIAVNIMYGETQVATEILSSDDNYQFSWKDKVHYDSGKDAKAEDDDTIKSIEYITTDAEGQETSKSFEPASTDSGWSVVELRSMTDEQASASEDAAKAKTELPLLRYYETTYSPSASSADTETFTITNTYSCKYIKLIKNIDGYDADGENVTFSFKIVGKDASGNEIYTNHAGVTFTEESGLTKEVVIENIPGSVESVAVTEEYSGNYELDGEISVSPVYDQSSQQGAENSDLKLLGWEVEASNKHDSHGPKGGAVNKYDHGQSPARESVEAKK